MPENAGPKTLSAKGKAALAMLRDIRMESGGLARDDVVMGICALFHEPLSEDGKRVISSLAPITRSPKLAIEAFLNGTQALESVLIPHDDVVRTSFGPLAGLNQSVAQQKVRDALDTLKVDARAMFGAQFDEVARYQAARKAQRE